MKKTLCILIILLAPASEVMADDDLDFGPGVFTGKKGSFTICKTGKSTEAEEVTKKDITETISDSKKLSQKEEFELFKVWKKLKGENSKSYQEFLLWVEYKKVVNQ